MGALRTFNFSLFALVLAGAAAQADDTDPWPDLQEALFPGKTLANAAEFMHITAPERAADAAVVPIEVDFDTAKMAGISVKTLTLVIDKNPAPVAAVFHFPQTTTNPSIGTRVRVNEYTNLHAIAEATDGRLFVSTVFVKAAGGCSAPARKNPDAAMAGLGEMKLKVPPNVVANAPAQFELLIKHPNFTGMQMDQVTRYYIPADFVQTVTITHAGKEILSIDGNISLSENPAIRFWLTPAAQGPLQVKATDSDGRAFEKIWLVPAAS